jgi:hypothetical protein
MVDGIWNHDGWRIIKMIRRSTSRDVRWFRGQGRDNVEAEQLGGQYDDQKFGNIIFAIDGIVKSYNRLPYVTDTHQQNH